MKDNIKDKIIDELFDLEIKMNGCSAEFWTELLLAEYNNKFDSPNMMDRYTYLAKKYNLTESRVERILRYGKENMKKRIREKYNIKTRLSNESIVILFKLKVF